MRQPALRRARRSGQGGVWRSPRGTGTLDADADALPHGDLRTMPDVLRQRPRIAVADPILTHPPTLAIFLSSDTERDDTVRAG